MLVGHDVQERQDVKNLMMRGPDRRGGADLAARLGRRPMDGPADFGAGRRDLGCRDADHARRFVAAAAVREADDEINTLAREINNMLDKIEQLTLGMRTVLDSAAHDLRTPLNRLQATAEGAMNQLVPGSAERRVLERVSTEVDHMRSTLDALLRIALAETGTVARESVDLSELVGSMVELYAPVGEERGIALTSAVTPGAHVQGSRQLLAQALANLLDNAIKFTPDGGHIRVLLRGPAPNRKWSSRTTGRAFPPISVRSCSGGACVWTRRAECLDPDSGCLSWRPSRNCTVLGSFSTTPTRVYECH